MTGRIRVLYVDDEPDLLDLARIFLEQTGDIEVTTSPSATAALDEHPIPMFDLIISDYQMPDMDGIAFLKEVRERFGDVPYILFTGRGREEVVIEAINNGVDFYLQKGGSSKAQFAELAHKIRQAVLRKRLEVSRRKAERDLRESEEKYRSLVDLAPLAVLACRDGTIVYANPECIRLAGAGSTKDLIGKKILPFIHPDDLPLTLEYLQRINTGATVPLTEIRLFTVDGQTYTVEAAGKPVQYGGLPSIIIVYRDITERKKARDELKAAYEQLTASDEELRSQYEELAFAQQKLWESRQQLSEIAGTVPGVIYQFYARPDGSRGTYFVSSRAREIFGISNEVEQFIDRFTAQVDPRDRGALLRSIQEAVASESSWNFEGRFIRPTGEPIWFQGIARPVKKKTELVYNGVLLDITGRKLAEEELRESEEKFRDIFNNTNDGIQIFELDENNYPGRFIDVNDVACRMVQYTREELLQKTPEDLDRGPYSKSGEVIRKELMDRGISTFEARHTRKDGSRFPVEIGVHSVLLGGKHVSIAVVRDITERKAAEESLRESERKFRTIFDKSHDAFLMFADSECTDCNQRALDLFGYTSRQEITGVKPWELSPEHQPDGQDSLAAAAAHIRAAREQGSNQFEWTHKRKDGSLFAADVLVSVYELFGRQIIFSSIRDITERKQMEEALFNSRQMLQAVLDSIPQRVFWKDRNSVFLGCNRPLALDVGYSDPAEMVGKTDYDHASHAIADHFRADDFQVMETGRPKINYEEPQIRSDGSTAWLRTSKVPLRNQDGAIIGVLGTYEDITGQKLAQEKLRESEEKFRHILENMQDAYIRTNEQGEITMVNPSAIRMFGYRSVEAMIGVHANTLYLHEGDREELLRLLKEAGGVTNFTGKTVRKDGTIFPVSINVQIITDKDGRMRGTEGILRDMSEKIVPGRTAGTGE